MKIAVLVKIIKGELNPFDACALESALRLSDDVTVISMAPDSAKDILKSLTRLGANVVLLTDKAFAGSDTLATSYILSRALEKIEYDLIICGRQSIDGDTAQVGPCLSATIGLPVITNVLEIANVDKKITCRTRLGKESANLPALITVERINDLRFPSIRSKAKDITVWDNTDVKADVKRIGLTGSPTRVLKTYENTAKTRHCKFVDRSKFLKLLDMPIKGHGEIELAPPEKKLKTVWAIGKSVLAEARRIGDRVVLIEEADPIKIAELAKKEKPPVILWNADAEGRRKAPIAAALLRTGLCADCTALDTDGERLYMYRPALSGNITAKIECRTMPQMATVRTGVKSADIIFSLGRGAKDSVGKLSAMAKEKGAELCASRGLVDMSLAPYDMQVGLTGKKVSPKLYVAIGISGAVHHTCAIEGADVVIAVNPDRHARIFDFADYGIVCTAEELIQLFTFLL